MLRKYCDRLKNGRIAIRPQPLEVAVAIEVTRYTWKPQCRVINLNRHLSELLSGSSVYRKDIRSQSGALRKLEHAMPFTRQ
ncbi:hypothetical protein PXNS11_380003 [Stutzerimonas xanthomarina]|nr:hypothetical protein PXNS11_380003 [Stutzerimonas xanthomarina]